MFTVLISYLKLTKLQFSVDYILNSLKDSSRFMANKIHKVFADENYKNKKKALNTSSSTKVSKDKQRI